MNINLKKFSLTDTSAALTSTASRSGKGKHQHQMLSTAQIQALQQLNPSEQAVLENAQNVHQTNTGLVFFYVKTESEEDSA